VANDVGTTLLEPQIVALLALDENDQLMEAKIAQKVDDRFRQKMEESLTRKMEEGEVIVAAKVIEDDSSTSRACLKKRTLLLLAIFLSLLLIIGGVVGGVLSSTADVPGFVPTQAATTVDEPLLEELRSLTVNATSDDDLWLFDDPLSPQSQALVWMKNDTIVTSPGRSKRDVY
jgi:hypothetical protein